MNGLLTTLVHEVYTHAEVELIHPLYQRWFEQHMGIEPERVRYILAWVTVHTHGTEKNHFAHAVNATAAFTDAMQTEISGPWARTLFTEYLRRKAGVMRDCAASLH